MKTIDKIIQNVETNIIGRVANKMGEKSVNNLNVLLDHVLKARGGNHLEIGSLFGGSAIAVALLMNYYNLPGIVFCIDPLNGYYLKLNNHGKDMSEEQVIPETIFNNIDKFAVGNRVAVMQAYSDEAFLEDITFSTAFIDGDHTEDAPLLDWFLYKDLVRNFVIFDNHDDIHKDVMKACKIANDDKEWKGKFVPDITYVLERING